MNETKVQFGEQPPIFLLRIVWQTGTDDCRILVKSTHEEKRHLFTSLEAAFLHIRTELSRSLN
ncbi:MAG: hypothetical protein AAF490_04335 [Chloroflexota bacterium]